jgi:hypothetical protein
MIDKNEMRNYRRDIDIDKSNLEDEWELHSSLYLHYADEYADAFDHKETAKAKLEWISSKLDLEIRQNYKQYGFNSKPAEGGIKSTIIINKNYQKALKKYNKANALFVRLTGVKTAFEHRKHAIGNLVALRIGGFYSEPRNIVKDVKKIQSVKGHEARKKAINEKMKNRKK